MKKNTLLLIAFLAISGSSLQANFWTTLKKYYAPPALMTGIALGSWELYKYFAQEADPSWRTYVAAAALGSGILTYVMAPKISEFDVKSQTMSNGRTVVTKTQNGNKKFAVYNEDGFYMPNNSTMPNLEAQEALQMAGKKLYTALHPNQSRFTLTEK
jgi:hypothetical protein